MIVFTYPGQGSQKPGMGQLWADHPSWELVSEASEAAGRDIEELLLRADAETLKQTRNAQLSTFVLSMVVLDAVSRVGVEAAGHAGHSLGEYSALTASGAVDFADAVRLVTERGEAMQVAAEEREGTMAAVLGLDDDDVEIACRRVADDVWIANYNGPGQVVIAGSPEAVTQGRCRRQRARRETNDGAAGVGRVPHAVHGGRARSAAQGDRPDRDPRTAGHRHRQRRRPAAHRSVRMAEPAQRAAREPGALEAHGVHARRSRLHHVRRDRPGHRADRSGEAHRHRQPHAVGRDSRRPRSHVGGARRSAGGPSRATRR